MADDREDVPCYISRCKCGALTFACVDDPEASKERKKYTAKDIAGLIREGRSVERSTVGYARSASWKCSCSSAPTVTDRTT